MYENKRKKILTLGITSLVILMAVLITPVNANDSPCKDCDDTTETSIIESDLIEITSGGVLKIVTRNGETHYIASVSDEISQIGLFSTYDGDGKLLTSSRNNYTDCVGSCFSENMGNNWFIKLLCGSLVSACIATIAVPLLWESAPVVCLIAGCCVGGAALGCVIVCFQDDGSYGSCFLSGTQITMSDGSYKNIEDITEGDIVKAYNIDSGSIVDDVVTKVFSHGPEEMGDRYLIINDRLKVTTHHPMYVNNGWETAGNINIGDELVTINGEEIIYSIVSVYTQEPVYDLELRDNEHYVAEDIVVPTKLSFISSQASALSGSMEPEAEAVEGASEASAEAQSGCLSINGSGL